MAATEKTEKNQKKKSVENFVQIGRDLHNFKRWLIGFVFVFAQRKA